jgi:deoxyribonuclease (pyrimidine dimer)
MTRINCIDVTELTDQHLLAEYKEITRVSSLARKLPDYGDYCMGEGHVRFFYNKGHYLTVRTRQLFLECQKRGFKVKFKQYKQHGGNAEVGQNYNRELNQPWYPTETDKQVNRARLTEKLAVKPDWYKYYGKRVS